jgi:uncharacterized protein YkwD
MELAASTSPTRRVRRFAAATLVVVAATLLSACLTPEQETVLAEMNHDRWLHGRTVLDTHGDAQAKAQAWAEKLAREGRLYHSNLSDGIHARWCGLGENVGYGAGPASIQTAYMNSPDHRANILNTTWNGAGVGYAKGKVNGVTVVFTVQVFIKTC